MPVLKKGRYIYLPRTMMKWAAEKRLEIDWRGSKGGLIPIAATEDNARIIAEYENIDADDSFIEFLESFNRIEEASLYKSIDELTDPPITTGGMWLHQLQAYHFAMEMPRGVLLDMFMGTGKTRVALEVLQNRGLKRVLIFAPTSVVEEETWLNNARKYMQVPYTVVHLTGPAANRVDVADRAMKMQQRQGHTVMAVTNTAALGAKKMYKWALNQEFDAVIVDESHKIKSPGGTWSKHAYYIGRRALFRMCLTGTPLPHSIQDAYAQFRFLDDTIFGSSVTNYRNRYIVYGGYEDRVIIGVNNEEEWRRKFRSITYSVGTDVLDLPEYHHIDRVTSLEPEAWRIYSPLALEFITEFVNKENCDDCYNARFIEKDCTFCSAVLIGSICPVCNGTKFELEQCHCLTKVEASNALVKALRLHEITGGTLDGQYVSNAKAKLLEEVLDELPPNEPVVIFTRFKADAVVCHTVAESLGRKSLELSGSRKELKEWQNGDAPILVCQIQSGAAGIDLTRAAYGIYYSVGTSLGDYVQSLSRIHRPGQERPTTYVHLLIKNTVDVQINRALQQKKQVLQYLLRRDDE